MNTYYYPRLRIKPAYVGLENKDGGARLLNRAINLTLNRTNKKITMSNPFPSWPSSNSKDGISHLTAAHTALIMHLHGKGIIDKEEYANTLIETYESIFDSVPQSFKLECKNAYSNNP